MVRIVVAMCGSPVPKLVISMICELGAAHWADRIFELPTRPAH
jgi:hypothetical protein